MAVKNQRRNVSYGLSDALLNVFPAPIASQRAPTANDKAQLGQTWVNTVTQAAYTLTSINNNVANWAVSSSGGGGVNQVNADVGFAVPAANVMGMAGSSNIATSGAGDTITFDLVNSPSVSGSITAGTGLTATTGNIAASAGNISASGTITAGTTLIGGTGLRVNSFTAGVIQSNGSGVFSSSNGTNGQVLIGGGAAPAWATLTAGTNVTITNAANSITINAASAAVDINYTAVNTTPYLPTGTDYYLGVDCSGGAITVTLPNAPVQGRVFIIKDSTGFANTNNITVTSVGGAILFDNSVTQTLVTPYESIQVVFNGTSYEIY